MPNEHDKTQNGERKIIELPEITRIEGHAAVIVDIDKAGQCSVQLQVFEGTRFFERIVLGHHFSELQHLTSRVCAICSTGHVLAAIFAVENALGITPTPNVTLLRELMHLGMIIESHATHVFALAMPDFVGVKDLIQFASKHPGEFQAWTRLRQLGTAMQTCLGGRPFHPVNLHAGGFSHYPSTDDLLKLDSEIERCKQDALDLCAFLLKLKPNFSRISEPRFLALEPMDGTYGYFGRTVRCTEGWTAPISEYKEYLSERVVPYSHAKRSEAQGKSIMVGSMARLFLFGNRLSSADAAGVLAESPLAKGDHNSIWNNLAQAIEIVEAMQRSRHIISVLVKGTYAQLLKDRQATELGKPVLATTNAGHGTGAIECPRGTLYHDYDFDSSGHVLSADMITPSAQNTARIELDIKEVVEQSSDYASPELQASLETLVRAYDPCNTCATHMVSVRFNQ